MGCALEIAPSHLPLSRCFLSIFVSKSQSCRRFTLSPCTHIIESGQR